MDSYFFQEPCEMQTVSFKIWNRVTSFISYDNDRYFTSAFSPFNIVFNQSGRKPQEQDTRLGLNSLPQNFSFILVFYALVSDESIYTNIYKKYVRIELTTQ